MKQTINFHMFGDSNPLFPIFFNQLEIVMTYLKNQRARRDSTTCMGNILGAFRRKLLIPQHQVSERYKRVNALS